jgi:RNA polymerase sigma factor (sigma-70 family)
LLDRGEFHAAAEAIVASYGPIYLAHLIQILRNDDDAREVLAQFNLDLWRGLATFDRRCPVYNWGYRLAHNAAVRHLKQPFQRRRAAVTSDHFEQLKARSLTSLREAEAGDAGRIIERFRAQLTPEEQALLTLRVHEGFEHEAIAEVLETSAPAVRKRWARLVRKLAALMDDEGSPPLPG